MKKALTIFTAVVLLALLSCGKGKSQAGESSFSEFTINSRSTGSQRTVGVYLPAGYDKQNTYPVVYMEDGLVFTDGNYRSILDSLVLYRLISPVVVVCSYEDKTPMPEFGIAMRNAEYLESLSQRTPELAVYFENHLAYFTDELIPEIEKRYSVSKERSGRIYYGTSNSADFGLSLSMRHPELFDEYWCFSPVCSDLGNYGMLEQDARYRICWGAKEESGLSFNYFPSLINSIRKRGGIVDSWTYPGGHDRPVWEMQFYNLLANRFPAE